MKPLIIFLSAVLTAGVASCNIDTADHTQEIAQMEDSVFAHFPTVNRVTVKVISDFGKEIFVTLGDKELYNGSEEERLKAVEQTSRIIRNIFKERVPGKGEVIFVEEETRLTNEKDPVKKYPVQLGKE